MVADAKIEVVEDSQVIEDQQAGKNTDDHAAEQQEAVCSERRKNWHRYRTPLFRQCGNAALVAQVPVGIPLGRQPAAGARRTPRKPRNQDTHNADSSNGVPEFSGAHGYNAMGAPIPPPDFPSQKRTKLAHDASFAEPAD
jgi:hypothetical protein